ncbi:MAG TPA: TIGR03435 family protein [Acidobacteriaceae bacterium]|nr:TIGR03435 family protein [Acidobacteriaceae bacterium]
MRFVVCAVMAVMCATVGAQTPPPASPQFEVASVRLEAKGTADGGPLAMLMKRAARSRIMPGDIPMRGDWVSLQGWTLVDLTAAAYRLNRTRVSGPAWMSDQEFDIEAKVAPGTAKAELNAMLRSLLEERFGLKAHRETRNERSFALVVGKDGPKMQLAVAPAPLPEGLTDEERKALVEQKIRESMETSRHRVSEVPGGHTGNSSAWASISMPDLAVHLERAVGESVVDDTGLAGKYAVRLETSIDPNEPGGTIFDAVERLGLKLEPRKMRVERVVVDEVSKMPTEN